MILAVVISSWWRWGKRNMHSWWEVNSKGVSLLNAAKKSSLTFLTQFSRPTCLRGQGVFYPCQDNDYNTLNVLLLFWVAFSHKGGSSWTLFSFKVFLLPSPSSTLPGPCSTGHSLSKTAPSTHLHVCAEQNYSLYTRYNCCTRKQEALLTESVFQKLCLNLSKCAIFCASGVCVPTHPIATLPQSQR